MNTLNKSNAKIKIICTLGPATRQTQIIKQMINAGMDVARINFSHGSWKEHLKILQAVRRAVRISGESVAVIQDLQGPKIRIGNLTTPTVDLKVNHIICITTQEEKGTSSRLSTTYKHLPKDVRKGDQVLLDDGKIELRVLSVRRNEVQCRIIRGGQLAPHKGINLPGVKISEASLTKKDKGDLEFAFEHGVDYVALSFVRRGDDIAMARDYIAANGPKGITLPIIAKIETGEAITNITEIIKEADVLLVARGDLGVELSAEDVPVLQKMIVQKCNELGKPVIVATQMLESMIANTRPTRAEASDVANAVLDGADAVMLSGETSVGTYPVESVRVMDNIIRKMQDHIKQYQHRCMDEIPSTHPYDSLCRAACSLAEDLHASAIVAATHTGTTALRLAKFRPSVKIIAVTDQADVVRRLNLIWGVRSVIIDVLRGATDSTFREIERRLLLHKYIKRGDVIVTLAGIPLFEEHSTNTIKVDAM